MIAGMIMVTIAGMIGVTVRVMIAAMTGGRAP